MSAGAEALYSYARTVEVINLPIGSVSQSWSGPSHAGAGFGGRASRYPRPSAVSSRVTKAWNAGTQR